MRYIGFLGNAGPSALSTARAAAFLEHIALARQV